MEFLKIVVGSRRVYFVLLLVLIRVYSSSSQYDLFFHSMLDTKDLERSVNSIYVDDDGVIYFSGFNSYYQYDGYTLRSILAEDQVEASNYGMIDNLIKIEDKIFACSGQGILSFDVKSQTLDLFTWRLDGKNIIHSYNTMSLIKHEDFIYISSEDILGGDKAYIYKINWHSMEGEVFSEISSDGGNLALDSIKNKIYSGRKLLESIDLDSRKRDTIEYSTAKYEAYDNLIMDIEISDDKLLLGVQDQGITVLNGNDLSIDTIIDVSPFNHGYQNIVSSITAYKDNIYFLTTYENSLIAFDLKDRSLTSFCQQDEFCLPKTFLYDVHIHEDDIYVAAHQHLVQGKTAIFKNRPFLKSNKLIDNSSSIYDIERLSNDHTILATFKAGGLYVFDDEGNELFNINEDESGYQMNPIQIEPLGKGVYIINNTYKLYLFDTNTSTIEVLQDYKIIADSLGGYPKYNEIFTRDGSAWVTGSNFIYRYDHRSKEDNWYDLSDRVKYCNTPYATIDNQLYINTDSSLMRYDIENDTLLDILDADVFDSIKKKMTYIYFLNDTEVFVYHRTGSVGGLINLEKHSFESYFDDLKINQFYYGISAKEEIYINTFEGLLRINPGTKEMFLYDKTDGLYGMDQNKTIGLRYNFDGEQIHFGLDTGVVSFTPKNLPREVGGEKIYIQNLEVHNESVFDFANCRFEDEIVLNHDQNFFTIYFQLIDYKNNASNELYYKLVNFESQFRKADKRRLAAYTNVPFGKYIFEIYAKNELGQRVGHKTLKIHVKPPWYKTGIFIIIASLLVLALLYQMIQLYIGYQKRNLEYEKRFAQLETMILKSQMNPHFIFNSLNSIRYLFMKDEKDKGLKYITKFAKLLRSTLHLGEHALVSLQEEIELTELFISLEQLRFNDKFIFEKQYEKSDLWKEIRIPPFVIQPIVENAFWHGLSPSEREEKRLRIEIEKEMDSYFIHIIDNGVGFDQERKSIDSTVGKGRSYGLALIRERFNLINKTQELKYDLQISDAPIYNSGSMVTIRINPS